MKIPRQRVGSVQRRTPKTRKFRVETFVYGLVSLKESLVNAHVDTPNTEKLRLLRIARRLDARLKSAGTQAHWVSYTKKILSGPKKERRPFVTVHPFGAKKEKSA